MSTIVDKLMEKLDSDERTQFFHFAGIISDPTTRKIMSRLASTQSSISIDSIPVDEIGVDKHIIIVRLVRLEKIGLVKSEKAKSVRGFCKEYSITNHGTNIVNKLMSTESKLFS